MTFGRWLLIHSFSIFLVGLMVFGYLYRDELRLKQAYEQLLNLDHQQQVLDSIKGKKKQQDVSVSISEVDSHIEESVTDTGNTLPLKPGMVSAPESTQSSVPDRIEATSTLGTFVIEQDALLHEARQAFWNKDYQMSIKGYQALLQREPSNADYSGELGNVYYAMNDYRHAAEMYYRSALILIDNGQHDAARQLLSPVIAMDLELGDRLKEQLAQ